MISFIAPAYNVNKYLDDFFSSFLKVECDFEIIFVDDKSPQDPTEYINKYKKLMKIKFIRNKKNLGIGFTRNEGLKHIDKKSTHVIHIDSDDIINDVSFCDDIELGKITWFNEIRFDTKKTHNTNNIGSFGKNLFTNRICGAAIPVEIAKEFPFETRTFEDMLVNRRIIKKYGDKVILSPKYFQGYRMRKQGVTSTGGTEAKFKDFLENMNKLIAEDINSYRFNIQEIYQYYWMWKKNLKNFDRKLLPDTKRRYKVAFWFTGSMIRWLHLEKAIYKWAGKNGFS